MAKIGVSKESLEGIQPVPVGKYTFRLDGFEPKLAKEKPGKARSTNLNPKLVVIGHPTQNDKRLFHNCNTAFTPGMFDMCHALGVRFENEDGDDPQFPGEFQCTVHGPNCDGSDPQNWNYIGPLAGQVGEAEVTLASNGKGGMVPKLTKFYCKVAGCTKKHAESLA